MELNEHGLLTSVTVVRTQRLSHAGTELASAGGSIAAPYRAYTPHRDRPVAPGCERPFVRPRRSLSAAKRGSAALRRRSPA